MLDICGALVGLVLTGIAIVIFGPISKKQSPGPILFSQKRVGRNGRIFNIYKIRTMYPDAEKRKKELMEKNKMSGLMFKMDNDPRIFPIGHFLRKTSIDELPQFWNVLTLKTFVFQWDSRVSKSDVSMLFADNGLKIECYFI